MIPLLFAAEAPPAPDDPSYGRIEGDMSVVVGLGATVAPRGPRAATDLRLRYLDTAGVFATYEDASILGSGSDPKRIVAFGVELRPLFLVRWLKNKEIGSPRLDLALDSLGLEIGPYFSQPVGAAFGAKPGLEVGLGLELPVLAHASGPWLGLHGGVRWSDAALGGGVLDGPADRAMYLSITVAWHQFFGAHVVDVGDKAP